MRDELDPAIKAIRDLETKVQFLLDNYVKTDDGYFCFPDGDTWKSHYHERNEEEQ